MFIFRFNAIEKGKTLERVYKSPFFAAFSMQAGLALHCNLLPFHLLSEPDIRGRTYFI